MRIGLLVRRFDLYAALLVMTLSLGGWMVCYERVRPEQGTLEGGYPVPVGTQYFRLISADGCVGNLQIELALEKEGLKLTAQGLVKAEVAQQPVDGTLKAEFYFNFLGQMMIGFIDTVSQDTTYRIAFQEIDPINLSIRRIPPDGFLKREMLIPGPIELKRIGSGVYNLVYRHLRTGSNGITSALLASLHKSISLQVEQSTEKGVVECSHSETRLALLPILNLLKKRLPFSFSF